MLNSTRLGVKIPPIVSPGNNQRMSVSNASINRTKQNDVHFTGGISDGIANWVSNGGKKTINSSKDFNGLIKLTAENGMLFSSILACALGISIRPVTIMAMPGNKDDKQYSAVKSIATGLVSLFITGGSLIIMQKGIDKAGIVFKKLEAQKLLNKGKISNDLFEKLTHLEKNPALDKVGREAMEKINKKEAIFKTLTNYGSKWFIGPVEAFTLFALIHPIMNTVFPKKNSKPEHASNDKSVNKKGGN